MGNCSKSWEIKKKPKVLELKRDFEEFVKRGVPNKGLIINRILFDINSAMKIIEDIEDDNLYKIRFLLDFYIPSKTQAVFKVTFNFRTNELDKKAEVTQFKHDFDYSLVSQPAILHLTIYTHIPVFSIDFFKGKKEIYKLPPDFELSERENYNSFTVVISNFLLDYVYL
jgi:hypothetical protein